ncbi:aminotransferase family protein [Pseudoroseicyclus sp. H15]
MDDLRANDPQGVIEADKAHVWHHLIQHKAFETVDPRIIVEGKGLRVWDINGREYLDAVSGGVWTVNVGYGRERIADAVREQLVKMCYFAGASGSIPGAQFAERLISKMPGLSRVYYANSGSEANEKAFKMVRAISAKHHRGKKGKILYRDRDYHGTTIGALSAGGQQERNARFGPFAPGFIEVPHCLEYQAQPELAGPDYGVKAAEAIEQVILREGPDEIGALCLEPVTAGGGCIVPPTGYWEKVQEICRKYDILLHIDEVVCGLGRTGTWFGYQQFGIEPDMVTMAKGVASGYAAISCCVTTEAVFDAFKDAEDPLGHFRDISTFGGCASGPVAALENIKIIEEEGLCENSAAMGEYLLEGFRGLEAKHEAIGEVRGLGLFAGIELVESRETRKPLAEKLVMKALAEALAEDVMIGAANRSVPGYNNVLLFAPALIATRDDIDRIVAAVDAGLTRALA